MKRKILTAALLALLCLDPAFAQWEGSVNADGAWHFSRSNSENADFKLKYSGKKFYVGTNAYFGHSFLPSTQTTSILDAKKEKGEYYKVENKTTDPRQFKTGINFDFGYNFDPDNVINASIGYGYNGTDKKSGLLTERFNNSDRTTLEGNQRDTSYVKKNSLNANVNYTHKFASRPDARLYVVLTGMMGFNQEVNRRLTEGEFYAKPKNYATFASLNDFNTKLSASYDDLFHLGNGKMKLKAGFDYVSDQDLDGYSAATFVNARWRDSTSYRQSYFYNSLSTEPYLNLTYSVGKFEFSIKERVQIYWHTLIDKLEDRKSPEELVGLFDKLDVRNLLGAGFTYKINERHRLSLDYSHSINRPDYKKLCPTLMIGDSEGEYFIGNTELRPETTDKFNFGYSYSKGIFVTRLDLNYRDKRNTAEKVIDLERSKDITDPTVKTIYTWINNKRQETFGSKLDFKMNGKDVKAEIWAAFNYDKYGNNEKATKEDFNYEIGTSVDVFLNETTRLSSSLAYISAKQSAYNLKGEDILANLRISKTLVKGLDIYAELKDIVNKEIYEETWNADLNYIKVSTTYPMHRAILFGIKYVF